MNELLWLMCLPTTIASVVPKRSVCLLPFCACSCLPSPAHFPFRNLSLDLTMIPHERFWVVLADRSMGEFTMEEESLVAKINHLAVKGCFNHNLYDWWLQKLCLASGKEGKKPKVTCLFRDSLIFLVTSMNDHEIESDSLRYRNRY